MNVFPNIYYTNPDHRIERKKYMESQFNSLGLSYTRVGMISPPKDKNPPKYYVDKLIGEYPESCSLYMNVYGCILFDFLDQWLSLGEDYLMLMEDDYDLSLMKRWHFTWEEFMDRLPYDWDCIQLGFETYDIIPFYLHPTKHQYSLGASLFKRDHIEKIVGFHKQSGKYKFDYKIADYAYVDRVSGIHDGKYYDATSGGPDYYLIHTGKSYSIPLIPINPYFCGISHEGVHGLLDWSPKLSFVKCYEAYYEWWNNDRDKFTLDEFFTYGKDNDILMERAIGDWDDKYFYELAIKNNE